MTGGLLTVWRQGPDGFLLSDSGIVISPNDARAVCPNEVDAPGRIGVVPDDVAETVDGVHIGSLKGLQGAFEGFEVRVNVGEDGNAHKTCVESRKRAREGTSEVVFVTETPKLIRRLRKFTCAFT